MESRQLKCRVAEMVGMNPPFRYFVGTVFFATYFAPFDRVPSLERGRGVHAGGSNKLRKFPELFSIGLIPMWADVIFLLTIGLVYDV